jgi:predicted molibdopterin-dependent oxidoreductase YjgC
VYTKGVAERAPDPYIGLSPVDAKMIGVEEGTMISLKSEKNEISYPVKIIKSLRNGVVMVSKGLPGVPGLNWGTWVEVTAKRSS